MCVRVCRSTRAVQIGNRANLVEISRSMPSHIDLHVQKWALPLKKYGKCKHIWNRKVI